MKNKKEEGARAASVGRRLSPEELAQVIGGITAKMPPLYYGDATYGDMRLIPRTPLVST